MKKYITNKVLDDGLGSRILKIINVIGYTYYLQSLGHDVEFVYTPLTYEGFGINFDNNVMNQYSPFIINDRRNDYISVCDRWEQMIGVKGVQITDVNPDDVEFLVHPGGKYNDLGMYNNIRSNKNKILDLLSLPPKEKKDYIDVAVHIRRGDVNPSTHFDRWIPDEYYLENIRKISDLLKDRCKITIYTQRRNFDASLYSDYEISYDDNTLDNEVWLKLVHADILIIGKSAYSYSAGMLSDGICLYENMFHPKVYDWVKKDNIIEMIKLKYKI